MNYDELRQRLDRLERMLSTLVREKSTTDLADEIDIDEAAKICNLTVKTLYTYVNRGQLAIPYIKRGGNKIYWKREDILRWHSERSYKLCERME